MQSVDFTVDALLTSAWLIYVPGCGLIDGLETDRPQEMHCSGVFVVSI